MLCFYSLQVPQAKNIPFYTGYYTLSNDKFYTPLLPEGFQDEIPLRFNGGSNIPYKIMYKHELDFINDTNYEITKNESILPKNKLYEDVDEVDEQLLSLAGIN